MTAPRLTIRRTRLDRDGLFLFGRRYAAQSVTLTEKDVDRLRRGRVIAVDVEGEYVAYIRLNVPTEQDPGRTAHAVGVPERGSELGDGTPLRQSDRAPSDLLRAAAARVPVNADHRMGIVASDWVLKLGEAWDAAGAQVLIAVGSLRRLWTRRASTGSSQPGCAK